MAKKRQARMRDDDLVKALRELSTGAVLVQVDNLLLLAADRLETLMRLDREAATHVEILICLKSKRFTGEPPYTGWKGLGKALREDYDELAELRRANETLRNEVAVLQSNLKAQVEARHQLEVRLKDAGLL